MALINIFRTNRSTIQGIALDAIISQSHESEITLTENPIEMGASITDHSIIEPRRLEMEVYVTDSPFIRPTVGSIVDATTRIFGSSNPDNLTRTQSTFKDLLRLQQTQEPLDIQTRLDLYRSMIIVSMSVVQDKRTSRVLAVNLKFKEARIVESQIVTIDPALLETGAIQNSGSPELDRGRVEPVTPTGTTASTALKTIFNWIGI